MHLLQYNIENYKTGVYNVGYTGALSCERVRDATFIIYNNRKR
jgi:hypothetical protein